MKFKHTKTLLPVPRKRPRKGFALIATLTLMMLLAMLAVAIMAVAASQNRIALQTMLQAEARQQALVGLDAAIGELQVELGPDRRVTANSGILDNNDRGPAQHLLGVWNSWDGPIYGKSVSGQGSKISTTYSKGRGHAFRRWMISSRDRNATRSLNAARNLCDRAPGRRICLVGEGTLGEALSQQHYVYADLISMPSLGKNEACFAWWVGGENQKAKVSVQNREEADDPYDALHRTWDTPAPRFVENKHLDFLPESVEEPARVVTMASLPLLGSSSQAAGMPYFYDVTTTSYTLPVNVSMGGLKQDLCLLLNKKSLKGTEFEARRNQDCPLVDNDDAPKGTEADMPIGSWQNLHAFYNCWPDDSARDTDNFTARLIGKLGRSYTRMSGSVFDGNLRYHDNPDEFKGAEDGKTYYDSRSMLEEGSKSSGYARTPVMLAFMSNFGLVSTQSETAPGYDLDMCFAPMFLWWNPYNVPMRVRSKQLWAQSVPYKTSWIDTYCITRGNTWEYGWTNYLLQQGRYGSDYGDYFLASEGNESGDIVFEPGEVIFFSPSKARVNANVNTQFSNPWVPGYNPSAVAGSKARFYTARGDGTGNTAGIPTIENVSDGKFYVKLRMGVGDPAVPGTDGKWFAPNRGECMTVFSGYNSAGSANNNDTGVNKRGITPQNFILGWYDPQNVSETDTQFCTEEDAKWKADGSQSDPDVPYYIAAVGLVAKSAGSHTNSVIFNGDYRSKIWQHSSPAFWGSALIAPDDQMRAYHPYQLAALHVSAGMDSAPMDNVGRNGYLGITNEGEQVSFASVLELPVHPPFSLAGFAGMRLQPGWYKANTGGKYATQGALRRMQYQAGVPGVGLGNAFADPCLPADDVYTFFQNRQQNSEFASNARLFGDFFDHGLMINDAMWDRWFCSSVSDMPDQRGVTKAEEVLSDFLKGKEDLPVSRYKRVNTPYNDKQIIDRIMADDGWKYIAQYLMIDGGFNVNSTSVDAWAAVLQGLAQRKLVTSRNDKLVFVEDSKGDNQVLFSRFMLSTTDKSVDSLGGYSMMQGSSSFRKSGAMASAWGEVRMLEPESIRELAEKIVEQVRERGPFLNMSDFVNRRLESGKHGLKGALQAAIDATDINRDFRDVKVSPGSGQMYKNREAAEGYMHTAAPGYLIQSDVLASLGNILTVRDDTFTVRAYGCVRNPRKVILAQAWCEAVVQRTMNYVDPTNAPHEAEYEPDGRKSSKGLSAINRVMGRQFRIVSFKWLDNWDI